MVGYNLAIMGASRAGRMDMMTIWRAIRVGTTSRMVVVGAVLAQALLTAVPAANAFAAGQLERGYLVGQGGYSSPQPSP